MKKFNLFLLSILLFTGCTYSITMVHTTGTADDVVDETDTTKAVISPTLSIPASVIP
jgi:hypothetical protein